MDNLFVFCPKNNRISVFLNSIRGSCFQTKKSYLSYRKNYPSYDYHRYNLIRQNKNHLNTNFQKTNYQKGDCMTKMKSVNYFPMSYYFPDYM